MNSEREELEARIAAYIDGTLPPADAARLEVFLANTDAKLAEQVIGMIGDKHRVANLPKPRAPDDLAARILEQVERTTLLNNVDQITHRRPWWQSRAAVAAAVFLFLGSFTYFILQAIHPANPAWQAALEPTGQHLSDKVSRQVNSAPIVPAAPAEGVLDQKGATSSNSSVLAATQNAITASPPPPVPASVAAALASDSLQKSRNVVADQPVMLTFFAQDADDERRLRDTLETLQAAGPASASLSLRSDRDRGNAGIPSELAGSSPTKSAAVPNNSNQYDLQSPVPDRAASNSVTQNNPQQSQALPSATAEAANVAAASSPASPAAAAQKMLTAEEKKAPATPVSYHVALRRADIEQLTRQFHLQPTDRPHGFGAAGPMGAGGGRPGAATAPADTLDQKSADRSVTLRSAAGDDEVLKDKQPSQTAEAQINCIITITPVAPLSPPLAPQSPLPN